ncbi:tetraacyldisaccharide 4'-kinase [Pseudohongiella sp.]|uniref:tetraacyldisaccharide 4'-kinase n=1 Tax=marine sediment metagenome TaxID=412755 RepID=A0A0F9Z3Q1_9ZZZZ|nr:tetraacyldisaccharide 4'-kinase [Pseudohongiella sp.]HDZ09017.1 tetraacyldisaccharide 4'-kinase [Pseudohongiella sp.]HEA62702.1 tetraacyldisaccharide 4'-kinase [Pseudohongiella sp.]
MFLVNAWYNKAGWLIVLRPLSLLFQWLAGRRRRQQEAAQTQAAVPVIVVGNIAVGGTGKTPLVLALCKALHDRGITAGVLSRGYGGSAPQYPFAVTPDSDVAHSGDEARLLRRHTQGPMMVDPQRNRGLQALISDGGCDVVISDDGLQHYRLWRDIEIVVVDGARGLGNGWCLPAGPLREPPARLAEVDYVVINGANRVFSEDELSAGETPVTTMRLVPEVWVNVRTGARAALQELPLPTAGTGDVHALAGIGNPQRFFATLRELGVQADCHAYSDHHAYSAVELAYARDKVLLMTEKDAVKCEAFAGEHWWYLVVSAELEPGFSEAFCDQVANTLARRQHSGRQQQTQQQQ